MKIYFDVHGSLTVEGEGATEWLALRTWMDNWRNGTSPLVVVTKTAKPGAAPDFGREIETDSRQLFGGRS